MAQKGVIKTISTNQISVILIISLGKVTHNFPFGISLAENRLDQNILRNPFRPGLHLYTRVAKDPGGKILENTQIQAVKPVGVQACFRQAGSSEHDKIALLVDQCVSNLATFGVTLQKRFAMNGSTGLQASERASFTSKLALT